MPMLPTYPAFVRATDVLLITPRLQLTRLHQPMYPWKNYLNNESVSKGIATSSISRTSLLSNPGDSRASSSDTTTDPSRFFELMSPIESVQPDQMSASALAYLGDVVFELHIRSQYVWPERRMSDLQNKVVSIVRGTHM